MFECAYIHFASSTLKKKGGKKNKCYIKTGLSWSASLVHCKPPSMENKEGGVDRQGFSPALSPLFSPASALASLTAGVKS